jgi:hypothetical protein
MISTFVAKATTLETKNIVAHTIEDKSDPQYYNCKLRSTTHPKTFNMLPCTECGKQENGILLHYTNFIAPCKCCGALDHGLYRYTPIEDNTLISGLAQVTCPSVWTTCIGKLIQEDRMSMKYRPCPQKLAEAHDYNHDKAMAALKRCYTQGSGWHMHTQQFNTLTDEVIQICYDARNPPFKRDTTHLDEMDDEELDL